MSQENLETVRAVMDAVKREDVPALVALSDADAEIVPVMAAVMPDSATFRGPGCWADYFASVKETWAAWEILDVAVVDGDGDSVAAVCRFAATGRSGGVPVDRRIGLAFWLREGKVRRLRAYLDPDDALQAVGLAE
jgi:ketosteroid isomerase-like protein